MREFYKTKHFKITELVDEETYNKFGEQAFMFFDKVALKTLDGIREYFGKPMLINNWNFGGNMDSRGFRKPTDPTGAPYGQHRMGRAFDFSVQGMTADEVRAVIIAHQMEAPFDEITACEIDVAWVHIDFRNIDNNGRLLLFKG